MNNTIRGLSLCKINKIRMSIQKGVKDDWLISEINEEADNKLGTFDLQANLDFSRELADKGLKNASDLLKKLVLGDQPCHMQPCAPLV